MKNIGIESTGMLSPLNKTLWIMSLAVLILLPANLSAQIKYTPEHPEVKAMADRAYETIKGGGAEGEGTLAAIAIIQYFKRYEGRVPKDHPGVQRALNSVLSMFPDGGNGRIMEQGECYFPALALILLCEYDSVKYKKEVNQLLEMFKERQRPTGAFTYLGQDNTGDTSQTQFVALAMWVAKTNGFNVDLNMAEKTLEWLCKVHRGSGQWVYKYTLGGGGGQGSTLSIQAAGLSSVYLMADMLQLYQRKKAMGKKGGGEIGFPRTVNIYVPPVDGADPMRKEGPLVNFDRGLLTSTASAGNRSLESRFTYSLRSWNYYYIYALERYAYFREQAEGNTGNGVMKDWYDQGIEYLKTKQNDGGQFPGYQIESSRIATSFALLFIVRASEVINMPPASTDLSGGNGFDTDSTLRDTGDGRIGAVRAEQNLSDMLNMLADDKKVTQEQLARINEALKKQIIEFRQKDDKSKGEIKAFLRSMVGASNYYRRMIAVRFLAGEQDMDNVPALIYALSDPDFRVAFEAHNGLRLISRKIDSMMLSDEAIKNSVRDPGAIEKEEGLKGRLRAEYETMESRWTDWFKKIRPDAQLLGDSR